MFSLLHYFSVIDIVVLKHLQWVNKNYMTLFVVLVFCLGITEYSSCGVPPKPKRSKLSLAKKKALVLSPTSWFNVTVTEEDIDESSKVCIPGGTVRNTNWAVRTFQQSIKQKNKCLPQEVDPVDILQKPHATDIVYNCLQRFMSEAKRMDMMPYPSMILY